MIRRVRTARIDEYRAAYTSAVVGEDTTADGHIAKPMSQNRTAGTTVSSGCLSHVVGIEQALLELDERAEVVGLDSCAVTTITHPISREIGRN